MSEQLTLLDAPESLSPRLKWMREKDIQTVQLLSSEMPCERTGNEGPLWGAWFGDMPTKPAEVFAAVMVSRLTYGATEDEAISSLVERNGWRMWNEIYDTSTPALETLHDHKMYPCPVCKQMAHANQTDQGKIIMSHLRQRRKSKGTGRVVK